MRDTQNGHTGLDPLREANARLLRENATRRWVPSDPEPKATSIDRLIFVAAVFTFVAMKLAGWI